jgi:Spy/CpxP family protein refolding chaperone
MLKDLDLSEAQWQSIHAIFEKHRGAHFAKQQTLESKEKILMTALAEPATTEAQLKDLHAAASDARLAVLLEGRTMMLEIQAVLNPEQQAKAKAQRLKMQQTMDEHRPAMEDPAGMGGPFLP